MQTLTGELRTAWLEERRTTGIGASEAAAACGLSKYRSRQELYMLKVGMIEPEDLSEKEHVEMGLRAEPMITQLYFDRTGREALPVQGITRHPDHPEIMATLDRIVPGDRAVELKNIGYFSFLRGGWDLSNEDSEQVPIDYYMQCQQQLAVTGLDVCDLAVLIAGQTFRVYPIKRDDELIDMMIGLELELWHKHIVPRVMPEPDFDAPGMLELAQKMYPGTDGSTVTLDDDELVDEYNRLGAVARDAKKEQDKVKAEILINMGDAAIAIAPSGRGFTRKLQRRKAYTVAEKEFIVMRYSKNPAK